MTCTHVLGLIDAGPFADYPRAHLDEAWRHAQNCATCNRALETSRLLDVELAALPQPVPSDDLTRSVLARVEQIDRARVGAAAPAETRAFSSVADGSAWATAFGAGAAALILARLAASGGDGRPDVATPEAAVLAVGLALYAAGMFTMSRDIVESR
jgi:hypothetical protein